MILSVKQWWHRRVKPVPPASTQVHGSELEQRQELRGSHVSNGAPWQDPPDMRLLADAICAGDISARNTVWNHFAEMACLRLERHPHFQQREDCRQQVQMDTCCKRLPKICQLFDRERCFLPLFMNALNFAMEDHIADPSSPCRRLGRGEVLVSSPPEVEPSNTSDLKQRQLDARSMLIRLHEMLSEELDEIEYAVFVLTYSDEKGVKEISRLLGIEIKQVYNAHKKIRRKSWQYLKTMEEEEEK